MSFFQVNDKCNGCLACVENCPACALSYVDKKKKRTLLHSMTLCARCGQCWRICPEEAIEFQHLLEGGWDEVVTLNLIRCRICGEPLYTAGFGEKLTEKLDEKIDPLCPKHRQPLSVKTWPHIGRGKTVPKRVTE